MTEPAAAPPAHGRVRLADLAGTFGAIVAALCCAGTPLIVGALAVAGLSSLRRDAILWPVMLVSLAVALWGFLQGRRFHGNPGPLVSGAVGAASLAGGVIVVHGPPAMIMIYLGAVLLIVATLWNVSARRRHVLGASQRSAAGGSTMLP